MRLPGFVCMKQKTVMSGLLGLLLAGCQIASSDNVPVSDRSAPPATTSGMPENTPAHARGDMPESNRGDAGARALLADFASGIQQRDFAHAYSMLSPADQQKWTSSAFAEIFAPLRSIAVEIAPGEMEGAAGSLFYTASVTITAIDATGHPARINGTATLRRVNDVPGATSAQLRWHFESVSLERAS